MPTAGKGTQGCATKSSEAFLSMLWLRLVLTQGDRFDVMVAFLYTVQRAVCRVGWKGMLVLGGPGVRMLWST